MSQPVILNLNFVRFLGLNNYNRSEDGRPKQFHMSSTDVRQYLSSQSIKSAVRKNFLKAFDSDNRGIRTVHGIETLYNVICEKDPDIDPADAGEMANFAFSALGFAKDEDKKSGEVFTKNLLYMSTQQYDAMAKIILNNKEALLNALTVEKADTTDEDTGKKKKSKKTDEEKDAARLKRALKEELEKCFSSNISTDAYLFGSFAPSNSTFTVDGATTFTPAYAVNTAHEDIDFFTAMDDMENVARYLDARTFLSSTVYHHISVDLSELAKHYTSREVAHIARVFTEQAIVSGPSGMSHAYGAFPLPSYGLISIRPEDVSLVQAVQEPVSGSDATKAAEEKIEDYVKAQYDAFLSPAKYLYHIGTKKTTLPAFHGSKQEVLDKLETDIVSALSEA